ncbi:hypothetical protein C8Q80DRAFT_1266969 [Daedaleopsis nitida]|nr:hypothetical protein C8Q80DRAFT_1266969 [Daedaleopsis nitida]
MSLTWLAKIPGAGVSHSTSADDIAIYTPTGCAFKVDGHNGWRLVAQASNSEPQTQPAPVVDPESFRVRSVMFDVPRNILLCHKTLRGWIAADETHLALEDVVYISQQPYKHGTPPNDVSPVRFYSRMCHAKVGFCPFPDDNAFDGHLREIEKFTIRVLLPGQPATHKPTQRNLHRQRERGRGQKLPITRGRLAFEIYEEINEILGPSGLLHVDGQDVPLDDLFLLDVRCVSKGSVQPTLAYLPRLALSTS